MARVKLSPLISTLSGSIGGVTFQRNKYGMTLREKPIPVNFNTEYQYTVRQAVLTAQAAWQALSEDQQKQWRRFPDFSLQGTRHNKSVKLSGHALYLKYQVIRLLSGLSLLTTINYNVMPAVPEFDKIDYTMPTLEIYFEDTVDVSEYWFLLRLTNPRPERKKFSPRGLRLVPADYTDGDAMNYEIQDQYTDAFGALPADDDVLHYYIQWFSYTSPVMAAPITGVCTVQ